MRATVEKACSDRALCILVVPVAILAPHWHALLSASVLPRREPYTDVFFRVRDVARSVSRAGASAPAEFAVFACNFSLLAMRAGLPPLSPCLGSLALRRRLPCGGLVDAHDRHRLREALWAQRDEAWSARGGTAAQDMEY